MKSILKKVFMCMIMLCIMVFIGSGFVKVKAEDSSYTLTFKVGSNDGSTASNTDDTAALLSAGTNYVTGKIATATKVYYSGGSGLKLGASSNAGTLKFNLSDDGKVTATTIVVNAKLYNASKTVSLSVNGSASQSLTADFADYTFTINSAITYIELASTKYCWISSIKVYYKASDEPSVIVSGDKEVKIGTTPKYEAELENYEDEVFWSTSDSNIATIDSEGNLTPIKVGVVNVTATIKDKEEEVLDSSTIEGIKVWPEANSTISIADAITVCGWCDTTASTDSYSVTGEITEKVTESDSKISIFISDGVNTLECYKVADGSDLEVGYNITVIGKLKKFNTTNEFDAGATYVINSSLAKYTVSYDSKGGSSVAEEQVTENGYANEPISPTKNGYDFVYWYLNDENIEFDFDTTPITGNITLNAKWDIKTIKSDINTIYSYMKASYKYDKESQNLVDSLTDEVNHQTGSYKSWNYESSNGVSYNGLSYYQNGNKYIQIKGESNSGIVSTTSIGTISKVTINWQGSVTKGKYLIIYGSNTPYTSSEDLYDNSKKGTELGRITYSTGDTTGSLDVLGSYKYIGIKASASITITIDITWNDSTYSDVDFRLQCGIDDDIAAVAAKYADSVYGIEISDGENAKKYASNNTFYKTSEESDYDYVLISLGDFLNNPDRITMEFTVRAYITFEDVTYYSENVKTYSVQSIIKQYYNVENETLVKGLYDLLVNLGYDMAPAA